MLTLYRRHTSRCPHRAKGAEYVKCRCPIWCDGESDGRRVRQSLKTRDWARAGKRLAELEAGGGTPAKPIPEAVAAFVDYCSYLEPSTKRKYQNVLDQLAAFCGKRIRHVADISVEALDQYRASRKLARTTATKELQTLRQFFTFCEERRWMEENPAKKIKAPSNVKPQQVEPYTREEIARILHACDEIGNGAYERLRARAMVLLLRFTGLRISDVATLARDRVSEGRILLRTQKTGGLVFLPVPAELEFALSVLPAPRETQGEPRCFFWNERTSRRSVVGIAERTMAAVFKNSGVPKAHAHRFRHTLATEILSAGGTEQEAADVLGISPHIVRKHYAKWSSGRQDRISRLFSAIFPGTNLVHSEKAGRNPLKSGQKIWCGEGDLNPHELSPASTSS